MRRHNDMYKMRVFAVSGYSGTGKTTLVEKIVRSLVERGHTVATLKSSKHEAGPEKGTDTWRHQQAGASMTVFLGPSIEAVGLKERINSDDLAKLSNYDFLIIEGLKSVNVPKFWCVRSTDAEINVVPDNTQAIVSWSDLKSDTYRGIPIISAESIDRLVEIVRTKAIAISEIE
jgi:molybdopterin-guanine dinucleotide biosynthesis protein B